MDIFGGARQGWVEFRSRPWVSAVAVATLALGIAGATTMFSMLSAIGSVMVPPGVDAARVGRVVWIRAEASGARGPLTAEEYAQLKDVTAFEVLSASTDEQMVLGGADGPSVSIKRVSADYFRTFGFKPTTGRLFTADDGPRHVAIVRDGFRARAGGLDPGSVVRLGGDAYTIVGVLPDRCWYPSPGTDIWLPLEVSRDGVPAAPTVTATARLRASTSSQLDLAQSQVATVGTRMARAFASALDASRRLRFITLQAEVGTRLGYGLIAVLGPAIVVLLITCANVANLLLARAARREREMAVRAALGASRFRLIRERLAESAWLAGGGGLLGLALSAAGVRLLRFWVSSFEQSRSGADAIQLDAGALMFALGVTLAVPLVFGLFPALAASKPNLIRALHQAPGVRRPRHGPYGGRDLLVIIEIGLAVVLVVTAVMFARFFSAIGNPDWGFDASRILGVAVSLDHRPSAAARDRRVLSDLLDHVRAVPGVRSAAIGAVPGFRLASDNDPVEFEDCQAAPGAAVAVTLSVGSEFFSTLGLPMRRGRAIASTDVVGAEPVAVISQKHAEQCWPGRDPIGRHAKRGRGPDARWMTIVGVVPNTVVVRGLGESPQPVYVPFDQSGRPPGLILARVDGNSASIAAAIRQIVRRVDPTQPAVRIGRLDESLREEVHQVSLVIGIFVGFAVFALALGALGVFSVMSYMVAERTREFGIRIALGASRREVLGLVLKHAGIIVGIGTGVSLAGTLAVTHVGFRELGDFAMTDPIIWATVCSLLAGVAVAASIVPARRAMRVEPVVALRAE